MLNGEYPNLHRVTSQWQASSLEVSPGAETLSTIRYSRDEGSPFRKAGLKLAFAFLFLRITSLHELIADKFSTNLFILYWFAIPAILCLVLSGGLSRLFRETTVRLWIAFAGWLLLAVPSSDWPGGSIQVTVTFVRTELPVLLLIAGLVITWSECWGLLTVLVASAFANVFIAFFFPGEAGATGRLEIGTGIQMNNSNDFAALLVLLLPFLILFLLTPGRFLGLQAITLAALGYGIYLILRTGSRGAMIALVCALVFSLPKLPMIQRVCTIALIGVFGCVMLVTVPGNTLGRLASAFSAGGLLSSSESTSNSVDEQASADESAESRWYLFKTSLLFTALHPVWGVGPGQFGNHEGFSAGAQGLHGNWHETHNSYTQASSEAGIPAALFLIAALILTYRSLSRNYHKARNLSPTAHNKKISLAFFCLLISFVAFCCVIFFLSLVYSFYLPLLTGLAIVLNRASEREWKGSVTPEEAGFSATLA